MSIILDGTAGVTFPASQTPSMTAYQGGVLTSGTAVASTSGTSIDFTSIPSWVKRITVMFNGVSTSGTSNIQIQLGAGSIVTTGYLSTTTNQAGTAQTYTTGLGFAGNIASANTFSGHLVITLLSSNLWISSGVNVNISGTNSNLCGGNITLSGTLDRVRVTTVNGTDTFDAGSINILYE